MKRVEYTAALEALHAKRHAAENEIEALKALYDAGADLDSLEARWNDLYTQLHLIDIEEHQVEMRFVSRDADQRSLDLVLENVD